MSANSSKPEITQTNNKPAPRRQWSRTISLPLWVFAGFMASSLVVSAAIVGLNETTTLFAGANVTVVNVVLAAIIYTLSLVIVVGVPWWLRRHKTTREELGLTRLPGWMDILLAPAGMIIYFLLSALLVTVIGSLIPGFEIDQSQTTGFETISQRYEYILAFVTLVVIAPVAEEVLFRGYLYGKLRKAVPLWLAIGVTSVLFGAVHGQWNVAIDTFALSVLMCSLREVTGSIWAGVLLHMMKNGLAFYLLFINPSLLNTMVG